jgi:hypothetical protein
MKKKYKWLPHLLNFLGVILGVYLAFYINEKAKSADERKERMLLLNAMIKDLSEDIKTYENYQIPINIQYRDNLDSMFIFLSARQMQKINDQLPSIFQVENYVPNTSIYNSITSSGKIKILEDLNLQKSLSDYYDGLVVECVKKNDIQVEFFMNEVVDWLMLNADLGEMRLLKEGEFIVLRNILMVYQSLIEQKISNYEMIVKESKALQEQLESSVRNK